MDGLDFKLSCEQVGNEGANGEPMATPWTYSKYLPWKREVGIFKANSGKVIICGIEM